MGTFVYGTMNLLKLKFVSYLNNQIKLVKMRSVLVCSFVSLVFLCSGSLRAQSYTLTDDFLLYATNFDDGTSLDDFAATDKSAWRIAEVGGTNVLELHGKSDYRGRVRSPFNIAVLKDHYFGDFTMEVRLKQTGRDYGHRDMCLFFGMQDPSNFYYVHMASVADPHAHNIFLVNDAPRVAIASKTTNGVKWEQDWHTIRIRRELATGTIAIYFDDMETPIMLANDNHFPAGLIGFGSFDDTGMVDDVKIWGPKKGEKAASFLE